MCRQQAKGFKPAHLRFASSGPLLSHAPRDWPESQTDMGSGSIPASMLSQGSRYCCRNTETPRTSTVPIPGRQAVHACTYVGGIHSAPPNARRTRGAQQRVS
jgi:hypothetical protein